MPSRLPAQRLVSALMPTLLNAPGRLVPIPRGSVAVSLRGCPRSLYAAPAERKPVPVTLRPAGAVTLQLTLKALPGASEPNVVAVIALAVQPLGTLRLRLPACSLVSSAGAGSTAGDGAVAAIVTDCVPSTGCVMVTVIVPVTLGRPWIQTAPAPPASPSSKAPLVSVAVTVLDCPGPVRTAGLALIVSTLSLPVPHVPGPVIEMVTLPAELARRLPYLSTIMKLTRVASEPSATMEASSALTCSRSLDVSAEKVRETASDVPL